MKALGKSLKEIQEEQQLSESAASRVLRDPRNSKAAKTAAGSALSSRWKIKRDYPYSPTGIKRLKCVGCGEPALFQFQICADGNNYRPVCDDCDTKINEMVLRLLNHPNCDELIAKYVNGG